MDQLDPPSNAQNTFEKAYKNNRLRYSGRSPGMRPILRIWKNNRFRKNSTQRL